MTQLAMILVEDTLIDDIPVANIAPLQELEMSSIPTRRPGQMPSNLRHIVATFSITAMRISIRNFCTKYGTSEFLLPRILMRHLPFPFT